MATLGVDFMPQDAFRAVLAFLTTLLFGISTGVLCANISTFFPPFTWASRCSPFFSMR